MDPFTILAVASGVSVLGGLISGQKQNKRAKREAKLHQEDINYQRKQNDITQKKLEGDLKKSQERTALAVARSNRARRRGGIFQMADASVGGTSSTLG